MCLTVGLPLPAELLGSILVKMGASCDMWSIAAVCKDWKEVTKEVRNALSEACSILRDKFQIAKPLTTTYFALLRISQVIPLQTRSDAFDSFTTALGVISRILKGILDEHTALPNLKVLRVDFSSIGDAGVKSLSDALVMWALPSLRELSLVGNKIGDAGIISLVGAMGALPSLEELALNDNQIGDPGMTALSDAFGNGALPNLEQLWLNDNKIGDAGLISLSEALDNGALPLLTQLGLSNNQIGDTGITSFVTALGNGALASLTTLYLYSNQIGDAGLTSLATALGNGALPLLTYIYVHGNPGDKALVDQALAAHKRAVERGRIASSTTPVRTRMEHPMHVAYTQAVHLFLLVG